MVDCESKPATVILVGCGVRGQNYCTYALKHPTKLKVVGLAEPREHQRRTMSETHQVDECHVKKDWRDFMTEEKFADGVIIATKTHMHQEPAVAFAKKGYHVMLETPMAITEEGCQEIYDACQENRVMFCACHVLRYSPPATKIKNLIDNGAVGDVVNIQLIEMFGTSYCCHAIVRGHHRLRSMAGSFILMKSGHDVDLISYFMGEKKCVRVSSFGHCSHFTLANKPPGSGSRCVDCSIERTCPYSAIKHYVDPIKEGFTGYPVNAVADITDVENVTQAIKSGPYGKCVYACDSDMQNHTVINMQFEDGTTASHTAVAFSKLNGTREVKIFGTMGEISCLFGGPIEHWDFRTGQKSIYSLPVNDEDIPQPLRHYWGSDYHVIDSFAAALRTGDSSHIKTGVEVTLSSHKIALSANKAMEENKVINL